MRVKVENAFGLLKGQWRRLKHLDVNSMDRAKLIIESCMLLHNFNISYKLNLTQNEILVNDGCRNNVAEVDTNAAGIAKRNALAASL